MERAIRAYQGQCCTLTHFFETGIKRPITSSRALFAWLFVWTADALNKIKVHDDGKTAYERITRHRCNHNIIRFGGSYLWQMTPDKTARVELNGDVRAGIFLGVIWRTTEYLIGAAEGVLYV